MANSCLSTTHASLRLPCPKLPDSGMMQLHVSFPRLARAHHLLFDHLSAPMVPLPRKRLLAVTAMVSQEEAAATAVEEQDEGTGEEEQEQEQNGAVEASAEDGKQDAAAPSRSTKLYFGNLPYNCDSAQLAGIVQEYASPEMVEVLYDRATGRSRGFAFVTMSTAEDCELVIKNLDGTQYSGRTMKVNFADAPKPKLPLYPETKHKLFVGNLSRTVTSEILTKAFEQCGNVVGARVLYDGETGRSRGYGFVCYSTKEEMDEALDSLNGLELEGREIRVNLALGKKY